MYILMLSMTTDNDSEQAFWNVSALESLTELYIMTCRFEKEAHHIELSQPEYVHNIKWLEGEDSRREETYDWHVQQKRRYIKHSHC